MALSKEAVIARANSADQLKLNWVHQYRDAYEFALPMRNLYSTFQPGADKMNRVFDSTAIISTQKFASRLQSNLTPPFQEFLEFLPGTDVPKESEEEATEKLQEIQKKFFGAVSNSNFDTVISEFYLDLSVGTAAMLVLEGDDDDPIIHQAIPNAQLSIDEGPGGSVDGKFRQFTEHPRNIKPTWDDLTDEGEAAINKLIAEMVDSDQGSKVNLLEATYFDHKEKEWVYQVILKGTQDNSNISQPTMVQNLDKNMAVIIVDRTYKVDPWIVLRWTKVAGEVFGRGPLLYAMPDIKTLNKATELMLQNASVAISGIWEVQNDSVANLDMIKVEAGAFFPVDKMGDIKRLDTPGRLDIGENISEKLQNNIKATLFDRALPDPTGPVRSPTEIIERAKELAQDIGSPFARLMSEFLKPWAKRVLHILFQKGIIDLDLKINGRATKILATSPLAKEQMLNDLENALRWIEINNLFGPEIALGNIKAEDFGQWSANKLGVDMEIVRDAEERKKLFNTVASLITELKTQPQQQPAQQAA